MNIGAISTSINTNQIQGQFGVRMLREQMDVSKEQGQALVDMIDKTSMERSVNPSIGLNFDVSV